MKFYDKTKELALFADIYEKSQQEAQMTVLVGRRRIGKTELALKCGYDNPLLYFFVARKSEGMLCQDFKEEAERKLGIPLGNYTSFAELSVISCLFLKVCLLPSSSMSFKIGFVSIHLFSVRCRGNGI